MIKFTASFGDKDKQVEIVNHFGGGGAYYIYIDRRVYGTINFQLGINIFLYDDCKISISSNKFVVAFQL